MLLFPHSIDTPTVEALTIRVRLLSQKIALLPTTEDISTRIFHQQILKSSLFSARIEGNTLTLEDAHKIKSSYPHSKSAQEVQNVITALQDVKKLQLPWTEASIKNLHAQIMAKITPDAGKFRHENSAIYDQWGNIVYLTPSPTEMKQMIYLLIEQLNAEVPAHLALSHSIACHYYFEKIHPFLDGNGRTGRVIFQAQLQQLGICQKYIIPVDEYLEKNVQEYYLLLEKNTRHIEELSTFVLKGLIWSADKLLSEVQQITNPTIHKQNLLPRRQEILAIIEDHPYASLDLIARRFPTIPNRTIAYDVQWLVRNELVIKHGDTNGVRYSAKLD